MSRGASSLMISQPAVSKQIGQLEMALRVRLLDRRPRGVALTEAGQVLLTYATRLFAVEAEAETAMEELRGLRRGRLRLGASTTLGVYLLPELFVHFRQAFPQIQLSLEVAGSAIIERRLADNELDLGFTEAFSGSPDITAEVLRMDDLVPIAAPHHPLARRRRISAEEFCRQPFVVRQTGSDTKSFVEQILTDKGLAIRPVMSLGTTEAIKRAVAAGIGVAIVSRLSISLELEVRRLAILPVTGLAIRRPLYALSRRSSEPSASALTFLALFKR
jgi:DNA-binding transcriptional LysR family regulator